MNKNSPSSRFSENKAAPRRGRWWLALLLIAALGGGGAWYYTHNPAAPGAEGGTKKRDPSGKVVPVVVAPVGKGDVGIYLNGLGTVVPRNVVTVRARVDGQLMRIHFQEGQMVKAGTLLAEIDPRPFQVQLAQAEGQMARDAALLKNAQVDVERYRTLVAQDSIARQQLDTQEALVRQYEGAVKIDQGQIDAAKLQLNYARITAPISGRVGLRQVDAGNLVRASDASGLVVITQTQPSTVVFTLPEDSLPKVQKRLKSGEALPVEAFDREQKNKLASGKLLTTDNAIDTATGTVRLKAIFANDDEALFPNQFVNARMLADTRKDAVLVPTAAIQRGVPGTFVYLVKEDKTVTVRPVKIGPQDGENIAIEEGLAVGEQVVIDGADKLREGAKIEVIDRSKRAKDEGRKRGPGGGEKGGPKHKRAE